MNYPTQREYARTPVNWPAIAWLNDNKITGRVLDCSWGGLFFSPDEECFLEEGDALTVHILDCHISYKTIVRWIGYSTVNEANGIGCEHMHELAARRYHEKEQDKRDSLERNSIAA